MYLYLVGCEKSAFVFQNIHLIDGYLPCVGDDDGPEAVAAARRLAADLEPAMWFKVTLLDHITVDCSRKTVKWSVLSPQKELFTDSLNFGGDERVTRSLYMENELDELESSIHTLFEVGDQLMGSLALKSGDCHKLLLEFLTDFVLPMITISREDEDVLTTALQKQQEFIKKLDSEIDVRAEKTKRIKQTLRDFRLSVAQDFIASRGKLLKSRPELYAVICDHLQKDIVDAELRLKASSEHFLYTFAGWPNLAAAESEQRLERVCAEVEELKVTYTMLTSPAPNRSIFSRRNVVDSHEFLRDRKPVHDLYMASSDVLETLRAESAELLERKVAAMSVKEAMCAVHRDLLCCAQTAGYETQTGTGRPATSIRPSRVSSSLSLVPIEEKLRAALRDPSHQAHTVHEEFCARTRATCSKALAAAHTVAVECATAAASAAASDGPPLLQEKALYARSEPAGLWTARDECNGAAVGGDNSCSASDGSYSGSDDDYDEDDEDEDDDDDSFCSVDRPSLDDTIGELRMSVARHCASVAGLLRLSDGGGGSAKVLDGPAVEQRKRLCYEYYLYERVGASLLALYDAAHGDEARQFADELGHLTADDLQLTDPWQLCLLAEARRSSGEGSDVAPWQQERQQQQPQQQPAAQFLGCSNGGVNAGSERLGASSGGISGSDDRLSSPLRHFGEVPVGLGVEAECDRAGGGSRTATVEDQTLARQSSTQMSDVAARSGGGDGSDSEDKCVVTSPHRGDNRDTAQAGRADASESAEFAMSGKHSVNQGTDGGGSGGCPTAKMSASRASLSADPVAGAAILGRAAGQRLRIEASGASADDAPGEAEDQAEAADCGRDDDDAGCAEPRRHGADAEPTPFIEWRREVVAPCVECLVKMTEQPSPLGKLQLLTRCLRVVASGEGKLRRTHSQRRQSVSPPSPQPQQTDAESAPQSRPPASGAAAGVRPPSTCSDDLIAATTLLLLCVDASLVRGLCVQLKFIEAFMSESLQSGVHAFSLTTYAGALWHLRSLVQKRSSVPSQVGAWSSETLSLGTAAQSSAECD